MPDIIVVKLGTLDDMWRDKVNELLLEIYCKRKDKWVERITDPNVNRFSEAN